MSQAESRLSRKIMEALRAQGYFCFKVHGGPTMESGLPDIICCAEGLFIGLETKMPSERKNVSVKQAHVHGKIRNAGGVAAVICSAREALQIVQELIEAHDAMMTRD